MQNHTNLHLKKLLVLALALVERLRALTVWFQKFCSRQNKKSMESELNIEEELKKSTTVCEKIVDMINNKEETTNEVNILRDQLININKSFGERYGNKILRNDMDFLLPNFLKTHQIIAELCKNLQLTENLGNNLLYCGLLDECRPYRMLIFVLLLNETANLKNDADLGYCLFREAYLMTDNIYGQLQNTTYSFVLKDYLTRLETSLPNIKTNKLTSEEAMFYNNLSNKIKVFRGMCDAEKQSKEYGISWTLDKKYAQNYVFYKKNKVIGNVGWIAEMEIDKNDIFAVWGADGREKEIVINPKKCKNVTFTNVSNPNTLSFVIEH
jgi:hypothetical protein